MRTLTSLVMFLVTATMAMAADWPQWQGPRRNAVSTEQGLAEAWPEAGPTLAWRIDDLGGGYSAPAVANGHLFGLSNRGEDEILWCRAEKDGQEVWAVRLGPAATEGMRQGIEGPGGTPTVDGDRLFAIGARGTVVCLRTRDGSLLWQRELVKDFAGRLPTWRYNESPLVDGDVVLATPGGEEATVVALEKSTGELVWKTKIPDAKPSSSSSRGSGRTAFDFDPVLKALDSDGNKELSAAEIAAAATALTALDKDEDGKLVEAEVTPDFGNRGGGGRSRGGRRGGRRGGGMMKMMPTNRALDQDGDEEISAAEIQSAATALAKVDKNADGKLVEAEVNPISRRGPASSAAYASPIAIEVEGARQYVQFTATALVGIDAKDGRLLWRYDRAANANRINCSTPVFHDGLIFAASAYGNGGGAVRLSKEAGEFKADEVYFTSNMQNHHGGMIVHDGCLYGANGGNGGGFLACLDFQTGDVLWRDRDAPKGALAFADNRLYLRTEEGTVILIEPNKEELVTRGRFEQPDRTESPAWTHPVIANGKLYIRDQDLLLCYDITAGS